MVRASDLLGQVMQVGTPGQAGAAAPGLEEGAGQAPFGVRAPRNAGEEQQLNRLIAEGGTPGMAVGVYAASLLAIDVDTAAERDCLRRSADGLKLTPDAFQHINQALGVPAIA